MMIAHVNQSSSTRLARVLKRSSQYPHKNSSCNSSNRWGGVPLTSVSSGSRGTHSLSQLPCPLTARCLSSSTKVQDEIVMPAALSNSQQKQDTWSKWELVLSSMAAVTVMASSLYGSTTTTSSNSASVTATSASTTATTTTSVAPNGDFGWGEPSAVRPTTSVVRLSHFTVEDDKQNDQMINVSHIKNINNDYEEEIDTSSIFQGENLDVSVRAVKGGRLYMEDEYFVGGGGRFVGVFDGHGGGDVSKYLRTHLYSMFLTQLKRKQWELDTRMGTEVAGNATSPSNASVSTSSTTAVNHLNAAANNGNNLENDPTSTSHVKGYHGVADVAPSLASFVGALRAALHEIDSQVLSLDEMQYQGSTAVTVTMHTASTPTVATCASSSGVVGSNNASTTSTPQRTLVVANVGDSRAVLSRNKMAVNLTRDHKPNEDRERARIETMGHSIQWDNYSKVYRVQNLSLSRAIGDRFAKPVVSGEAEITIFPIEPKDDEFVVLASDGLWDVMESDEVVQFIHQRMSALVPGGALHDRADIGKRLKEVRRKNMSRYVASEALKRGSEDNVCVLIIWLKPLDQS